MLLASSAGALVGFAAGFGGSAKGAALARRLAYVFAGAMAAANVLMVGALLARDFSVGYVAQVGSREVPDWVAVTSLWSSLEGSILFWGVVLGPKEAEFSEPDSKSKLVIERDAVTLWKLGADAWDGRAAIRPETTQGRFS